MALGALPTFCLSYTFASVLSFELLAFLSLFSSYFGRPRAEIFVRVVGKILLAFHGLQEATPFLCLNPRPVSATPWGMDIPRPQPPGARPSGRFLRAQSVCLKPGTPVNRWENELCLISGWSQLALCVVGSFYSRELCGCVRTRAWLCVHGNRCLPDIKHLLSFYFSFGF